jgi:hypothetical protein
MSNSHFVYLTQLQLKKSHYKADIEALHILNNAAGTSFCSLSELCTGLEWLDCLRGLPYGGAAPKKIQEEKPSDNKSSDHLHPKTTKTLGLVTSITDAHGSSSSSEYTMHQDAWISAINLTEEQRRKL